MFSLTSAIVLAIGFIATPLGAIMFFKAKKGEQNTLGGIIFIIGLICIGFGWWGL